MANFESFDRFLGERRLAVRRDEPLAPHTTFKIGGPCRWFAEPATAEELALLLRGARENGVPVYFLGGGSNLLVRDAVLDGLVVRLHRLNRCEVRGNLVHVEAGYRFPALVKETAEAGLGGIEVLGGIPGRVGGALVMNAGGKYGEIGPRVEYVDVLDEPGGVRRLDRPALEFGYRRSNLAGRVVLGCGLRLEPRRPEELTGRYRAVMDEKKNSQPLGSPNSGCIFKNPPGDGAGRLIEAGGMKGEREGGIHVSRKHANFMINEGGGRAADVQRLIDRVRDRVAKIFRVLLEPEVYIW